MSSRLSWRCWCCGCCSDLAPTPHLASTSRHRAWKADQQAGSSSTGRMPVIFFWLGGEDLGTKQMQTRLLMVSSVHFVHPVTLSNITSQHQGSTCHGEPDRHWPLPPSEFTIWSGREKLNIKEVPRWPQCAAKFGNQHSSPALLTCPRAYESTRVLEKTSDLLALGWDWSVYISSRAWRVLCWGDFTSRGPQSMPGDAFSCQNLWWRKVVLAASECRSRILLHIPQCTGQLPQQKDFWPQTSPVPRAENPFARVKLMLLFPLTTLRGAAESPPPAQPPLWAKLSKSDQEFLTKQADAVSKDEFCLWLGFWWKAERMSPAPNNWC